MDEREKHIYEAGEDLLSARLMHNISKIEAEFQAMQDTDETRFYEAIQEMLLRVNAAQEREEKGSLRYIYVNFLQSSLYTKSYQLRMDAYDERQFGDMTDCCAYWSPQFIFEHFEQDMAYFRKHISSKVLRVREYEIMRFAARYAMHYFRMIQELVTVLIRPLVEDVEELTVLFGGYLDQALMVTDEKEMTDEIFSH